MLFMTGVLIRHVSTLWNENATNAHVLLYLKADFNQSDSTLLTIGSFSELPYSPNG